ncbi:MAG TPA: hypothetical protein VLQ80_07130 [Candidatus Saccharimonadia bacterium]|nr:hypothetical protein [Candidatus Saccharimonadia bacterium]
MTRAERAAEKAQKEKAKVAALERLHKDRLATQQAETRKAEAARLEATRKDDQKRRYHVGALAQEAGLFAWGNSDVAAVFAVLARLVAAPNPAGVLEGVLGGNGAGLAPGSDDVVRHHPIAPGFRLAFSAPAAGEQFESESPSLSSASNLSDLRSLNLR